MASASSNRNVPAMSAPSSRRSQSAEIVSDPNVMCGMPVIRGTRVLATVVAAEVAAGRSDADILGDYPSIDRVGIQAAVDFMRRHPGAGHG